MLLFLLRCANLSQPEPTIKGITELSGGGNGDSFRARFVCATATSLT
jgi:hypothetical protein